MCRCSLLKTVCFCTLVCTCFDSQGVLEDCDSGRSVNSQHQQPQCSNGDAGGQPCRTAAPASQYCSCRRVDCLDLLRRNSSTSDVSADRATSAELQQSMPIGDEARNLSLSQQQQNSTLAAIPHVLGDVRVTPI